MEITYIQFNAPQGESKAKEEGFFKCSIKNIITNLLTKIIPKANPDFDHKIEDVIYWLVECELENGVPQREIGLDEQGLAIMKMPYKNNYGYWTDNNLLLKDFKEHFNVSEITKEAFEQQWSLFDKIIDFKVILDNFKILTTGNDGGHRYVSTEIMHKGIMRHLTVFFANKSDEEKISRIDKIIVAGRLMDEGVQQSLILLDAELIHE